MWYLARLHERCLTATGGDEAAAAQMEERVRAFFSAGRPQWFPNASPAVWFSFVDGKCDLGRPLHVIRPRRSAAVLAAFPSKRDLVGCFLDRVHEVGKLRCTELWDVREAASSVSDAFAALQIFTELGSYLRDYYPERVRRVLVLGATSSPLRTMAWALVPAKTREKVVWCDAETDLRPYVREAPSGYNLGPPPAEVTL